MNERLLPLPDPLLPPELDGVCMLVADLVGSTRLARQLPLHQYVSVMSDTVQLLILHFEAYGAEVLQHQGDAVVCVWPKEDAASAVMAAQHSHSRTRRLRLAEVLGLTLELRVGLAVGDVIRVNVGGAPTCYGLPVNLARRLASAAAPGETLTCPALPVYAPGVALGEREVSNLSGFEELGVVRRVLDTPALPGLGAASAGMKTG